MDIDNFISIFQDFFQLFMKIKGDERKFCLLPLDSQGYFSDFIKRDHNFTFSCQYDMRRIEIYYKKNNKR